DATAGSPFAPDGPSLRGVLRGAKVQAAGPAATRLHADAGAVVEHRRLVRAVDFDEALFAALPVRDRARPRREDRVVAADAGARARAEPRPALADEDHPGLHVLAREDLHAEHLRIRVATVARRAESLLVRHQCPFQ